MLYNLYQILENAKQSIMTGDVWRQKRRGEGLQRRMKDSFDFGDSLMGIFMSKLIKLYTLNMCNLL